MRISMSGRKSWRATPFSTLLNISQGNSILTQRPWSGKRYFTQSARLYGIPDSSSRARWLDEWSENIYFDVENEMKTAGQHVDKKSSRHGKRMVWNENQLGQNETDRRAGGVPQSDRHVIYNRIRRDAYIRQMPLDPSIYKREFEIRSGSLYPFSGIHPRWSINILTLFSSMYEGIPPEEIWNKLSVESELTVASWIKKLRGVSDTISFPSLAWGRLSADEAARRWPDMVLWFLLNSPREALIFLRATSYAPYPPFRMVSDCFRYLDTFHRKDFESAAPLMTRYRQYLLYCLGPAKWPVLTMSQIGLRLYLKYSKSEEVVMALEDISKRNTFITLNTLLYLMDLFLQHGDIKHALNTLQLIKSRLGPSSLSTTEISDRCFKLLTLDTHRRDDESTSSILQQVIELGVEPSREVLNVVMSNALRDRDEDLAWSIFHFMGDEGITPDSYTYLSLLTDAVRRGDTKRIRIILQQTSQTEELVNQPHLISKTLHAIHVLSQESTTSRFPASDAFQDMLHFYRTVHDTKPLVDLGIIAQEENNPHRTQLPPPSRHALTTMITAFLRTQTTSARVRDLFDRFRELVVMGHETIAPLAETDHVFNSFLTAFRSDVDLLHHCVKLVETMLQPLPDTAVLKSQGNRHVQQAMPTIRTWTILLHALLSQHQPQAAGKVREMMLSRGVRFNDVTWNVMIRGFARMQMVKETAAALKVMEKESWSPDGYTVHAVGLIRNQELLRTILLRLDAAADEADYQENL